MPRSPKPKRSSKLVPAEEAGWRLAFSDDFERNELGDGTPVLEHQEAGSTIGDGHDRVGFYFYTAAKVRQVRVYVKATAN